MCVSNLSRHVVLDMRLNRSDLSVYFDQIYSENHCIVYTLLQPHLLSRTFPGLSLGRVDLEVQIKFLKITTPRALQSQDFFPGLFPVI